MGAPLERAPAPPPVKARAPVVGIFGKHPGWPDHIALPLESAALRELRSRLYDGIRAAISRGARGEKAAGRILPFGHRFCAAGISGEGGWVIGRVWESADAVGRREYPMAACVHVFGGDCQAAMAVSAGPLAALEAACRAATTQAQVLAALAAAAKECGSMAAAAAAHQKAAASVVGGVDDLPAPRPPAKKNVDAAMAASVSWDWLAELALLAQAQWRRFRFRGRAARHKGVRLRRRDASAEAALCQWAGSAQRRIAGRAAVFAACADGELWVDLVVGELTPAAVVRLRIAGSFRGSGRTEIGLAE
jgi:hypothetical protein